MKLTIFFHLYKGRSGLPLSIEYIKLLYKFVPKISIDIKIYSYALSAEEVIFLKNELSMIGSKFIEISFESVPENCESEIPTLRRLKNYVEHSALDDEYIMYLHSKGASYADPIQSKNIANSSILAICAMLQELSSGSPIQDEYNCFGPFLSLGVFRRYDYMSLAYSGNFWFAKASYLNSLSFPAAPMIDSYFNRHLAEEFVGLKGDASSMFNILDESLLDQEELGQEQFVKNLREQIRLFFRASQADRSSANNKLNDQITALSTQQALYSKGRIFWSLRRRLFGNGSYLRRLKLLSYLLDIIFRWHSCELYRFYILPSHWSVLAGLSNIRKVSDMTAGNNREIFP